MQRLGGANHQNMHGQDHRSKVHLLRIKTLAGKIQPSMAADGHFAAQNVLLGTLASSPVSPAPWLDFSFKYGALRSVTLHWSASCKVTPRLTEAFYLRWPYCFLQVEALKRRRQANQNLMIFAVLAI